MHRDPVRRGTVEVAPSVLLVDDDPELRDVVELGLGRQGMRVAPCASAADAFARIGREEHDCVVTDLAMPGMHGFELIERIVANEPELPVIVLTGAGNLATAVAA